ncbi:hypothetical protein RHGRI_008171 [Rhododendron griersonianum]|uniref:Uncharacterized protein n=1 Tax=Rhododendron griersonianum TaxID=479676 RepID=A0AAV6KZD7_9ERIC|nr:hypothetical protein RHGRI_008171 [Rhododendron griersonianum]
MLKFLMGVVAGYGSCQNNLPFNIGKPYSSAWGSWTHSRGTSKVTSAFICQILLPHGKLQILLLLRGAQSKATIIDAHGNLVKIKVPITATEIMLDEPGDVVSLVQPIKY